MSRGCLPRLLKIELTFKHKKILFKSLQLINVTLELKKTNDSTCKFVWLIWILYLFVSNARSAIDTMSAAWQFPTKKVVNKSCESGPIRMSLSSIGKYGPRTLHDSVVETMASSLVLSPSRSDFRTSMRYLIDPTLQRRQRWESSAAESLCEIYVQSRIRNRRVVQKLQRGVKVTDIHDGFRVARLT